MENLKAIREKKRVTQVRLSIDIGVTQETISAYECGRSLPSVDVLIKLADRLGTSTDYLLNRTEMTLPFNKLINDKQKTEEIELLHEFRKLKSEQKSRVMGFIQGLLE